MTAAQLFTDEQFEWYVDQCLEGASRRGLAEEMGISRSALDFPHAVPKGDPHAIELYSQAICTNKEPTLFEYDPYEYPDVTEGEWEARMERAIYACEGCPVMILCGQLATADERMWTVRGGLEPHAFRLSQHHT